MIVCPTCQTAYAEELNFCGRCGSDMRRAPPPEARPDPWVGKIVDGRYRVLEKVGHGGMGAVYRVEHAAMGKIAAMKVLHGELASDREAVRRFRREAESISRLGHPNTVQVFDFGNAQGALYLVMEYVRGEDLGAVLRRDKTLDFARTAAILSQVCGSVGEAHDLGMVHRDLKPENIMIGRTKDGGDFVKVLDFGLAKMREREELASVTARGSLVGTPYYMAPEQIRSEREPDGRADIYALGAVMYRMLTGDPPFSAQTPVGVLTKHLTEDPIPPRAKRPELQIPGQAETIVLRALQKRPEDRFQSVDEMRESIEHAREALFGSGKTAKPSAPLRREADHDSDWQIGNLPTSKMASPLPQRSPIDRLSRSDFDRYERALRRQKYVRLAIVPMLAAAMVAGGWYWQQHLKRTPRALDAEVEPNNDTAHANTIASGHPVRGKIGQRLSREEGDRDVYRIPAAAQPGARVLHAEVTGLPNLDIVLEVFDSHGEFVAQADARGEGEGEIIPNLRIGDGEAYVVVREMHTPGSVPGENVSDEYALSCSWHLLGPGEEAEPNDAPGQTTRLAPGLELKGYLGHRGDIDAFKIDAPPGAALHGTLVLPAGIDARVQIADGEQQSVPPSGAPWEFDVKGGEVLRLSRIDPVAAKGDKPALPGLNEPYRIVVR